MLQAVLVQRVRVHHACAYTIPAYAHASRNSADLYVRTRFKDYHICKAALFQACRHR